MQRQALVLHFEDLQLQLMKFKTSAGAGSLNIHWIDSEPLSSASQPNPDGGDI